MSFYRQNGGYPQQHHQNSISNNNYTNHILPSHQYKKIFCAYHRTQFLTNFCIQKDCLMPMCPSCVAQHTQYHNKSQQKPNYINLQQALHQVKQKCYTMIVNLQDNQRRNEEILSHVEDLPDYLHQQLSNVKDKIFQSIQQIFQEYQNQILKDIQKRYQQYKVYNRQESQDIRSAINGCIDSLYDKICVLKGDQCLAGLITYYGQDQKAYQEACQDIQEYLSRHKKTGKMNINMNKNALMNQLDGLCYKTLTPLMVIDENVANEPLYKQQNSMVRRGSQNGNASRSTLGLKNMNYGNINTSFNNNPNNNQQINTKNTNIGTTNTNQHSHNNSHQKISSMSFNNRSGSRVNQSMSNNY